MGEGMMKMGEGNKKLEEQHTDDEEMMKMGEGTI